MQIHEEATIKEHEKKRRRKKASANNCGRTNKYGEYFLIYLLFPYRRQN